MQPSPMHGLSSKWSYLSRTTPDIGTLLQPLEHIIHTKLYPSLTKRPPPNATERDLLALPARLGGIALTDPTKSANLEFSASTKITEPLKNAILQQNFEYSPEIVSEQLKLKREAKTSKQLYLSQTFDNLKLSPELERAVELAQEKGASSWLTSLPIEEFGFALHKGAFQDAITLRYNWPPTRIPTTCACGNKFSVDHAMSCPKGGFPSIRHNEIRDLTAKLLTEVCNDVCTEPDLQPLTGEVLTGASETLV